MATHMTGWKPLTRRILFILVFFFLVWAIDRAAVAEAHLLKVTDLGAKTKLEKRRSSQLWNLRHARYVAQYGKGPNREWHRKAAVWIARELAETERALRPPAPAITGMWYEIAVCETGRRPPLWNINTGNGFYGGLQFLTSTWLAYGGGRYAPRADLATPSQQVSIASGMSLSHWPVCGRPYR
jgi:hypothetical protein